MTSHTITSLFFLALSFLISATSGCVKTENMPNLDDKVLAIESMEENTLTMTIELVVGKDQSRIKHAGNGWVLIALNNQKSDSYTIYTWSSFGAGLSRKNKLSPSYSSNPQSWYNGFASATFSYEFINNKGNVVKRGDLLPPDDPPLILGYDSWEFWRPIDSPPEPGEYELRIHLDLKSVNKAINSHSDSLSDYVLNEKHPYFSATAVNVVVE